MEDLKSWKGTPVVPLDENAPLYKGDRIVIRFKWFLGGGGTYLKSAQLAIIDKKLAGRSDFVIRSFVDQGEYLDCEVEVLASPPDESGGPGSGVTQAGFVVSTLAYVTAIFISSAVMAVCFTVLRKEQYRLIDKGVLPSPTSLGASVSEVAGVLKALAYVAGVLVVLYVFKNILGNGRGRRNQSNGY